MDTDNNFVKIKTVTGGKTTSPFIKTEPNMYDISSGDVIFSSDEGKEAFLKGDAFIKVDGSCSAVILKNGKLEFYRRQDAKDKMKKGNMVAGTRPANAIPLADGGNPADYECHHYCWVPLVDPAKKKGPLQIQNDKIRNIVQDNQAEITKTIIEHGSEIMVGGEWALYITVELCGPDYNKTPGLDSVALVPHCKQLIDNPPRNYPQLCEFFRKHMVEGLIYLHNNRAWKIKAECMPPDDEIVANFKAFEGVETPRRTTLPPVVMWV